MYRGKNMAELGGTPFAVAPLRAVRDNISTGSIPLTMPETTDSMPVRVNASAGHLSVHVDGEHPVDIPFLFEQPEKRIVGAFVDSADLQAVQCLVEISVV